MWVIHFYIIWYNLVSMTWQGNFVWNFTLKQTIEEFPPKSGTFPFIPRNSRNLAKEVEEN